MIETQNCSDWTAKKVFVLDFALLIEFIWVPENYKDPVLGSPFWSDKKCTNVV